MSEKQRSVPDIIQHFKEEGTEVKEIQTVEIDGVHILGFKFDHKLSSSMQECLSEKMARIFPNNQCLVLLLNEHSDFHSFTEEHEEALRKTVRAHSDE